MLVFAKKIFSVGIGEQHGYLGGTETGDRILKEVNGARTVRFGCCWIDRQARIRAPPRRLYNIACDGAGPCALTTVPPSACCRGPVVSIQAGNSAVCRKQ